MKVVAFSKNLIYGIGGAERSMFEELKKASISSDIKLCSVKNVKTFNADNFKIEFPSAYELNYLVPKQLFSRFFYNEYLVNRSNIINYFSNSFRDCDELWAQNLWAPAAINSFKGRTVYFARDESFLNLRSNYHKGVKRLAKSIYDCIEYPGYITYVKDNVEAIQSADVVIANSEFMANKIQELFNRKCKIITPYIDKSLLKNTYYKNLENSNAIDKGVVMMGDDLMKGVEVFKKLACCFPKEKFYIFGRKSSIITAKDNIVFMPWAQNPTNAYKYAKVVVVPSICLEAYGRVAAESLILNIPCLVNNIGGLPEAVNYQEACIYNDFNELKSKLNTMISAV